MTLPTQPLTHGDAPPASEDLPHPLIEEQAVADGIALFSAWVEAQMAKTGLPGLSVGLVYDQDLVWSQGFGVADVARQQPATPRTLYRCASITKLFTSVAVMQLRDAGRLRLDDPIQEHLPWFVIRDQHPGSPAITIRHLLTHTSGLPREADFPYWLDQEFPDRASLRAKIAEQETTLPRETTWKYSNLALTLAGEIVEAVSGQPYTAYVQEQILAPLQMTDTFIETIDRDHPQLATGYSRQLPNQEREIAPFTDCRVITPAANLTSNVADLAQFAMLQFRDGPREGGQILRGSTLREMQRVHWLNEDWQAGRGLGFYVWRYGGRTLAGHGGALRGYRTEFQVCPADKVGVIVLTNADDGNPLQYVMKMFDWIVPALVEAAKRAEESGEAEALDLSRYQGKFRNPWRDTQILLLGDRLVALDPSLADPKGDMVTLEPVSPHTFRMKAANPFGADGELLRVEFDEAGRIARIQMGAIYAYPVDGW